MRQELLVVVALLASCTAPTPNLGFAVALTIKIDGSVDAATLAQITHIKVAVPEESYAADIPLTGAAHRTEGVTYYPKATSTSLTFNVIASASNGGELASGQVVVAPKPGATKAATVTLSADTGVADAGADGGSPDGAPHGDGGVDGGVDGGSGHSISFVTTPLIATGTAAVGEVIADFNSDGRNDLAVATTAKVLLFFAQPDHTFPATASATLTDATAPGAIAVGDFGGDGTPDLVVSDKAMATLFFYINDGHGTLTLTSMKSTLAGADSIVVADFDKDGDADVLVGSSTAVSLDLHRGSTKYDSDPALDTAYPVGRLHTADLNLDGYPDLVYTEPGPAEELDVKLSFGGSLVGQSNFYASYSGALEDVVTSDLSGDGRPEVILFYDQGATGNGTLVLDNDNGTIGQDSNVSQYTALDVDLQHALAYDFEGNATVDVIATRTDPVQSNTISVARNVTFSSGSLAFVEADYVSGTGPGTFAVGDLDGDGLDDIAVANSQSHSIGIMRQLASGKLYAAPVVNAVSTFMRAGDFNGDGKIDLISSDADKNIYVTANDGLGNFSGSQPIPAYASGVAVVDANEDGSPDLVWGTPNGYFAQALAITPGSFATATYSGNAIAKSFIDAQVADFDGDKHGDVVLLSDPTSGNSMGKNIAVLFGSGTGTFGTPPGDQDGSALTYSAAGAVAMLVADVDEDGKPDVLALSNAPAQVFFLRGMGASLGAGTPIASPVTNATSFIATDVDGDGHLDLVIGGDSLYVLRGSGTGTFTGVGVLFDTVATTSVVAGDTDGDGISEVMAATKDSLVHVWKRQNGALVAAGTFAAGAGVTSLIGADFSGSDHLTDLVVVGNSTALLRNDTK